MTPPVKKTGTGVSAEEQAKIEQMRIRFLEDADRMRLQIEQAQKEYEAKRFSYLPSWLEPSARRLSGFWENSSPASGGNHETLKAIAAAASDGLESARSMSLFFGHRVEKYLSGELSVLSELPEGGLNRAADIYARGAAIFLSITSAGAKKKTQVQAEGKTYTYRVRDGGIEVNGRYWKIVGVGKASLANISIDDAEQILGTGLRLKVPVSVPGWAEGMAKDKAPQLRDVINNPNNPLELTIPEDQVPSILKLLAETDADSVKLPQMEGYPVELVRG